MSAVSVVSTAAREAVQSTLAGEHAAVWTLALLGARTSTSAQPGLTAALDAAYAAHRQIRDDLTGIAAALGLTPVAAAPAYQPPAGLDDPAGVTAAALAVEQACLTGYVGLVAASTADLRRTAIGWLDAGAVRALTLGGRPETLPGAGELATSRR